MIEHSMSIPATSLSQAIRRAGRRTAALALRPAYAVYTARLRKEVLGSPRPKHVALIMDGNRRWAAREGKAAGAGHRAGADTAFSLLDWCAALGIGEVTLWALSLENLDRAPDEVNGISEVARDALELFQTGQRKTRVPIRLRVIGRAEMLPERLRQAVREAQPLSHEDDGTMTVTVALGYSGRDELVEAARTTVRDLLAEGVPAADLPDRLTADGLEAHLYTVGSSDPDLIIRTSGEVRMSGFLPWQSVHSEFYFCEVYWPAFREIDFLRAIRTYQQRHRRYGR